VNTAPPEPGKTLGVRKAKAAVSPASDQFLEKVVFLDPMTPSLYAPAISGPAARRLRLIIAMRAERLCLRQGLLRQHVFILCLNRRVFRMQWPSIGPLGVAGLGAIIRARKS